MISERLAEVSLDAYHQSVYDLAREGAAAIAARFEEDVRSGRIDLDDLFDRSYQPLPNTQPTKYRTRFDSYTDQVLPGIQEQLLERNRNLVFAIACTPEGYVPTHNRAFAHPPSATRRRTRCAAAASACSTTAPGFAAAATSSRCCYRPTPVTPAS